MDKTEETPKPDLTQALRVWAKKKNLRPIDFSKHMGWGYSHAWAVLKGDQHFSPEAHGTFIHIYGIDALSELYRIAKIEPKGTVDLEPA